jgi:hypothetical protein
LHANPTWVCIPADQVNAFNSVDRQEIFDRVAADFPALLPFVAQYYAKPGRLTYQLDEPWPEDVPLPDGWRAVPGNPLLVEIPSQQGCTQGDPMGTFLYSLAIHPVLREAARLFPDVVLSAYADDLLTFGAPVRALEAWKWVRAELLKLQLVYKPSALKAWSPTPLSHADALSLEAEGIQVQDADTGFMCLGTPIGMDAWAAAEVVQICLAKRDALAAVAALCPGDVQDGLLRYCANSWVLHLGRTCTPAAAEGLRYHDRAVENIFFRAAGSDAPSDFSRAVAHLPLAWGGFGMEPSAAVAPRAYLASWLAVRERLARLYAPFADWMGDNQLEYPGLRRVVTAVSEAAYEANQYIARASPTIDSSRHTVHSLPEVIGDGLACMQQVTSIINAVGDTTATFTGAQSSLAVVFHLRSLDAAFSAATPCEIAILGSAGTRGAMTWLEPTLVAQYRNTSADHVLSKQFFLGLPFVGHSRPDTCAACRGVWSADTRDAILQHFGAQAHASSAFNTHLHKPIVALLRRLCSAQGYTAKAGGEAQSLRDGLVGHTADVVVSNFGGPGVQCRIDVKTGSECGVSSLRRSGPAPRRYAEYRETKTHAEHEGQQVVAFIVTLGGCLGQEACQFIKDASLASGGHAGPLSGVSWCHPTLEKAWHKAIRAYVVAGRAMMLREILGSDLWEGAPPGEDLPPDFERVEVTRLEALDVVMEGERASRALREDIGLGPHEAYV